MTKVNNYLEFKNRVTMGMVDGHSVVDKFGKNDLITTTTDPEDVWEGGGKYTFSTTADIVSIASTAGDTQTISIQGLGADWEELSQTITLTGTVRVAIPIPFLRVHRMENEGNTNISGIVKCYTGTGAAVPVDGDSKIRAIISGDNNQTLMAIYTIPAGKVGFLYRGEAGCKFTAGVQATDFATVDYKSKRPGEVFKTKKEFSLTTTGTSIYKDERSFPDVIPEKTDLLLEVKEVSADMGVWATFDILLVDEDKLSTKFLRDIGQIG